MMRVSDAEENLRLQLRNTSVSREIQPITSRNFLAGIAAAVVVKKAMKIRDTLSTVERLFPAARNCFILMRTVPEQTASRQSVNAYFARPVVARSRFGRLIARQIIVKRGGHIMESSNVVSSKVRELCEAVSQEENPEQMSVLVNELIRVLDEPQQQGAEVNRTIANC